MNGNPIRNVRGSSSSRVGRRRLRPEVEESCEQLSAPVERGTAEMERVRTPGNEESACDAIANIAGGEPRCGCLSAGEDLALPRREGGKFSVGVLHQRHLDKRVRVGFGRSYLSRHVAIIRIWRTCYAISGVTGRGSPTVGH